MGKPAESRYIEISHPDSLYKEYRNICQHRQSVNMHSKNDVIFQVLIMQYYRKKQRSSDPEISVYK